MTLVWRQGQAETGRKRGMGLYRSQSLKLWKAERATEKLKVIQFTFYYLIFFKF
jgi:hypothetical protein